jgi:predicted component of type VI protein secretion system
MERLVLTWVNKPFAFELMPGLNRLGRNPTNDHRIADGSISSFHCEAMVEPDNTVLIRDLASTNGTFIDGIPLLDGALKPGQTLRMGSVEFRLEVATVAEPAAAVPVAHEEAEHTQFFESKEKPKGFLGKLTQTLKIPWSR